MQCWRTLCVHGLFHLFEVRNLGAVVSIMSILTAKSAREVCPKVFVVFLPFTFFFIVPLGVLVTSILVSPSRLVLLGVVSSWSRVDIVSFFSFLLGIIPLMGLIFRIQLFKSMKLLNGRGLNKVNVDMQFSMWRSHGLWWTKKWKLRFFLWQRFIGSIRR
jgi:hypothetical protein